MIRRLASRIEKLETVWLPQVQVRGGLQVVIWNGTDKPEPFMTLYWEPGRPGRTVYHTRAIGSPQEAP